MSWIYYRFKTRSVDDPRPLISDARYPWWCSGYSVSFDGEFSAAIIVAYLPKGEELTKYWDDAFDISQEERDAIRFTDRFPKPEWFTAR